MIADKLTHFYPGARWAMTGDTYDTLQWLDASPKPTEAELAALVLPPPVPEIVSRFQARAALMQIGKLAEAEAIVAQADAITQLAWAEAIEWKRSSPALNGLAEAMGLTQAGLDDLFRAAAEIEV
jgi:hypothetical protein